MKKVLFIDRDGTLAVEPPKDYQLDAFEKLEFLPGVFTYLSKIVNELDFQLVMVTNQDGLGTDSFPSETFWPVQQFIIKALENEGIYFEDVHIDPTFPHEKSPNRKPGIGLLGKYFRPEYDLEQSFVIGDRETDALLAQNLGSQSISINIEPNTYSTPTLYLHSWKEIYRHLKQLDRKAKLTRNTNETKISVGINLDGGGLSNISTGLSFLDHMLDQIAKHAQVDLEVLVRGDLEVDEHHTIEDTAIALGQLIKKALAKKVGIARYGFCLPMDDCLAQVAMDFGGRAWLEWDVSFHRERIGDVPTEMFFHFFKSFTDNADCNINMKAEGDNEHHKIEGLFKAFAKALKMAKSRDVNSDAVASTKGIF